MLEIHTYLCQIKEMKKKCETTVRKWVCLFTPISIMHYNNLTCAKSSEIFNKPKKNRVIQRQIDFPHNNSNYI